MTKKRLALYTLPPIAALTAATLWLNYTHDGRVFGLYAFAAFKAPLETKIACARETNDRVTDKFVQPLDFDEVSKNTLREYWHFSYYRECLFNAGYDFYGNPITPTELVANGDKYEYTNYFAGISFTIPGEASFVYDNVTNPDLDDYIIASQLLIGGESIMVNFDRSYKVAGNAALESVFAGFESKIDFTSPTLTKVASPRSDVLAYEDDDLFGYVVVIPDHHIVTIYGHRSAQSVLESIVTSLTHLP